MVTVISLATPCHLTYVLFYCRYVTGHVLEKVPHSNAFETDKFTVSTTREWETICDYLYQRNSNDTEHQCLSCLSPNEWGSLLRLLFIAYLIVSLVILFLRKSSYDLPLWYSQRKKGFHYAAILWVTLLHCLHWDGKFKILIKNVISDFFRNRYVTFTSNNNGNNIFMTSFNQQ